MTTQQAVVDQIVQNLAFEVEAVPKNKSIQDIAVSQITPLNVKIKVRKKDDILKVDDVSTIDDNRRAVQKIRLVNSHQTIMTFDVFMEAEFEKKPSRNRRKHIFDMLRPGICLGAVDDDEYPYMPSSSYSANITDPSVINKSDGTMKQTFTLSKNVYQTYTTTTPPGGQKWLFGKCKPGGCLDPPFSEDKYAYKPSIRAGSEREAEELVEKEDVRSDSCSKKQRITPQDEEVQSKERRHSSIFDSSLFKKKQKSSDKSTNTKLPDKTDSVVDIYQGELATNSVSTRSNSIITYPLKVTSHPKISENKTVGSRDPSEVKSRKSFNDHSEPYFIRPKGVIRIKEKEKLDPSDYSKRRSSDATDIRNSLKESSKMPVPLPIPIPISMNIMSNKRKPEDIATNDNILNTQGDSANITELDAIPDQQRTNHEAQDVLNLKGSDMSSPLFRDTSSKIAVLIPSNVEQPTTPAEIADQHLYEIQPLKKIGSENNIEVTTQPSRKTKTEHLKVPSPVSFIISAANRALDPENINDNLQRSETESTKSKQSLETTPPTFKDTPVEDSKELQEKIDPVNKSGRSTTAAYATPESQCNDKVGHTIPKNYLRARDDFSDNESESSTIKEVTKQDSKSEKISEEPAKQYDIKDKDSIAVAVATIATVSAAAATAVAAAAAAIEENSEIYNMPDLDTQQTKSSQQISLSNLPIKVEYKETDKNISILSPGKTSAASVSDNTKRSDSPDKHLYNVGHKDTDQNISILTQGKTSAASVTDNIKRSNSPVKHLYNVGRRDTDKSISKLSRGKTSAASVRDNTKNSDIPNKYLGNTGHRDTDENISILSRGKSSAASVTDKTKRSYSPGKDFDNTGHKDTDFGDHIEENQTSLSSRPTSAEPIEDKSKRSDSADKHLDNVGHRDTDKSTSKHSHGKISAASVSDNTRRNDSPDKHLDNFAHRDTDKSISILTQGKTSAASVTDKQKRRNSPDKHLDNVKHTDTDKSISKLSRGKPSAASLSNNTTRRNSPDKDLGNIGHRGSEKNISISSRGKSSAASVTDKTIRRYSPDKDLHNTGHKDTDFVDHIEEKPTSLSSRPTSAISIRDKSKRSDSPDKHLDNVGPRDTDKSISKFIRGKTSAASVSDNTMRSDSTDKRLDNVGHRDTDKSISKLSRSKTSAASVSERATDFGDHKGEKRTSLSSRPTSAASMKDKSKRSVSPDQHLDNVEDRNTDFGVHKDEKRTSLSSGPESPSDKQYYLSETEKPNSDFNINSNTENQGRFTITQEGIPNFKIVPVIINNTKNTPNFESHDEVYNNKMNTGHDFNPSGVPFTTQIVSRFSKFDEDDGTHSTVSRDLMETKSVIYDTEEYIHPTFETKNVDGISSHDKGVPVNIVTPSNQSTSTLKSAMKKDTMSLELGFHSYINDKNERILRTFDTTNVPKRSPYDSVTVLKSVIKISSNEIRIPVDSEHDMSIRIKKSNANQRVSISESGFGNVIDNGGIKKQRSAVQHSVAEIRSSEAKPEVRNDDIHESISKYDHFIDYYEKELLPLQVVIKNLKEEIDVLAAQQLIFKEKLCRANKSSIPRLVHSNKKCFGCVRK